MDSRQRAARYYDAQPNNPSDLAFYRGLLGDGGPSLLELGCGTGRVLVPLSESCGYAHGIDSSAAMLDSCRRKLNERRISESQVKVEQADISSFRIDCRFDLVLAPFRVFQNLETDAQVSGMFNCVRDHLARGGSGVLTAFRPNADRDQLIEAWSRDEEVFNWEVTLEGRRLTRHHRNVDFDPVNLVVYPELIYRLYEDQRVIDEAVLPIAMRSYYPDEFVAVIESNGFTVTNTWGGYDGEPFSEGPEMIAQFQR